ncbi:MAG: DUF1598 domain-containing protein [Planctomycetia bacterium]
MTTVIPSRSGLFPRYPSFLRRASVAVVCAAMVVAAAGSAKAQMGFGGFGGQAVGGISVDAHGIVRTLDPEASQELAARRREILAKGAGVAGKPVTLRKVSLARLCKAVDDFASTGKPLSADVVFLGGLERITHVFVDPDGHDVILAGPADAAVIDPAGNVVSAANGRPLLQLEDLITALRAIDGARAGGVRCSIDPSPEGVTKLQRYLGSLTSIGANPESTLRAMENVLGPQKVTVGGVPAESRIARVLVAADYRMKRIGMGLEPSGVAALPSYLSMVPAGATSGATLPRFWLEAEYDPITRDPDELAWRLSGRRMKCLTESDIFAAGGPARGKAPADKVAQAWCASMTQHYDELARRQPVFAELTNCVDLCVVAALIHGRQLDKRAGLDLAPLVDATRLTLPTYEAPATLSTVATGFKKGSRWIVSASGGVQFQPWAFATNTAESAASAAERVAAIDARPADAWYWD